MDSASWQLFLTACTSSWQRCPHGRAACAPGSDCTTCRLDCTCQLPAQAFANDMPECWLPLMSVSLQTSSRADAAATQWCPHTLRSQHSTACRILNRELSLFLVLLQRVHARMMQRSSASLPATAPPQAAWCSASGATDLSAVAKWSLS